MKMYRILAILAVFTAWLVATTQARAEQPVYATGACPVTGWVYIAETGKYGNKETSGLMSARDFRMKTNNQGTYASIHASFPVGRWVYRYDASYKNGVLVLVERQDGDDASLNLLKKLGETPEGKGADFGQAGRVLKFKRDPLSPNTLVCRTCEQYGFPKYWKAAKRPWFKCADSLPGKQAAKRKLSRPLPTTADYMTPTVEHQVTSGQM